MTQTVAVLFARPDSIYKSMPGCDVWDIDRDARKWPGGAPVVAHPPCRLWASLRTKSKAPPEEKEHARWAMQQARENGGVLEHPWLSTLWDEYGLRAAGKPRERTQTMRLDRWGFMWPVKMFDFGFPAEKRTGLYICGLDPNNLPPKPFRLGEATHTVGLWSGRDKANCKPSIGKAMFDQTPLVMAEWLVEIARRCSVDRIVAA